MRRIGSVLSLLALCALPACASKSTDIAGAHLAGAVADGSWGGENAQIVASDNDAVFRLRCAEYHSMRPLVPNADGSFVLNLAPANDDKNVAAVARGTVHGTSIDFSVTYPITPGVHADGFSVTFGVGPMFTFLCSQG